MSTRPLALPISDIINVSVVAPSGAVAPRQFNQGLIVGSSAVIPSYGTNPRLRQYASLAAMIADGFTSVEPEYIAASLYFSQNTPPQFVWIGRQDLTAIETVVPHTGAAGTGYAVGDTVTPTQAGASNAKLTVLTIGGGGSVLTLGVTIGNQGTGYSVASNLPTTTSGAGTGLTVDISAVGESLLQAVEACALTNQNWYGFMAAVTGGVADSDHLALAAYSSANFLTALYFGASADVAILNGIINNLALQMQTLKDKAFLLYSSTQGGVFPNNVYAAAAVMGLYCGLDTGLPGSAFTLNLKALSGVAPEALTQTQYTNITNANCNVSAAFGPYSGYLTPGILSSGDFFDQILFRATLVNLIQINLMNLLVSTPKVPQTDAGEHQLITQVDAACSQMASIGYLGPGIWTGGPINDLKGNTLIATGDALPRGYLTVAPSFNQQSTGNRAARQAMPISCAVLEAGAVHSVQIQVSTQL